MPLTPDEKPRRSAVKWWGIALILAAAAGLWWGKDAVRTYKAFSTSAGDLDGIWDCGALAHQEGRPSAVRYGCMVPAPSHRVLEELTEDGWPDKGPEPYTFWMGAQSEDPAAPGYDEEASSDERPVRRVTLDPFWITRYEITVEQYAWCVEYGPCTEDQVGQGGDFNYGREGVIDHPINGVTWFGADTYCRWTGGRLPTEAEWEFVARAGGIQRDFPWEGEGPVTCEHAVHAGPPDAPCGVSSTSHSSIHPRLGEDGTMMAHNLAGNVWEWTSDWYGPNYGTQGAVANPEGPPEGPGRVQRGGGFTEEDPLVFRASFRAQMAPDMKLPDVGFRCAADRIQHSAARHEASFLGTRTLEGWSGDGEPWAIASGTATPPASGGSLRWEGASFESGELMSHMWVKRGAAGLRYGLSGPTEDGFELRIDADAKRISLFKRADGTEKALESGHLQPPHLGAWHRLSVRVEEGIHRVSNHGQPVMVVYDNDWPGAEVGIFATAGADVHVSDVAVTD